MHASEFLLPIIQISQDLFLKKNLFFQEDKFSQEVKDLREASSPSQSEYSPSNDESNDPVVTLPVEKDVLKKKLAQSEDLVRSLNDQLAVCNNLRVKYEESEVLKKKCAAAEAHPN